MKFELIESSWRVYRFFDCPGCGCRLSWRKDAKGIWGEKYYTCNRCGSLLKRVDVEPESESSPGVGG